MLKQPNAVRIWFLFEHVLAKVVAVKLFFVVEARLNSVEPALIYAPRCLAGPAELLRTLAAINEDFNSLFRGKLMTKWAHMICWTYTTFVWFKYFRISTFLLYYIALFSLFSTTQHLFLLCDAALTSHLSTKCAFAFHVELRIYDVVAELHWTPFKFHIRFQDCAGSPTSILLLRVAINHRQNLNVTWRFLAIFLPHRHWANWFDFSCFVTKIWSIKSTKALGTKSMSTIEHFDLIFRIVEIEFDFTNSANVRDWIAERKAVETWGCGNCVGLFRSAI